MKKELIHTRKIMVNCYETDEERLIIEGYLTDERLFPYVIHALNEKHNAGLMHHITLTMELSISQMRIVSMSSDAVQGVWSYYSRMREGRADPPLPGTDGSILLNSCYMWREEGPFVEKIRQRNTTEHKKGH